MKSDEQCNIKRALADETQSLRSLPTCSQVCVCARLCVEGGGGEDPVDFSEGLHLSAGPKESPNVVFFFFFRIPIFTGPAPLIGT